MGLFGRRSRRKGVPDDPALLAEAAAYVDNPNGYGYLGFCRMGADGGRGSCAPGPRGVSG
ncbi:hypothetical protein EF912_18940 [Streptomyces sp. WAC07061]|nr:hypothetical protein EF912_18940 [Streptomyces sp. WAC07061]